MNTTVRQVFDFACEEGENFEVIKNQIEMFKEIGIKIQSKVVKYNIFLVNNSHISPHHNFTQTVRSV